LGILPITAITVAGHVAVRLLLVTGNVRITNMVIGRLAFPGVDTTTYHLVIAWDMLG